MQRVGDTAGHRIGISDTGFRKLCAMDVQQQSASRDAMKMAKEDQRWRIGIAISLASLAMNATPPSTLRNAYTAEEFAAEILPQVRMPTKLLGSCAHLTDA